MFVFVISQNKQYEWINKGTAAILMGPRGQNAAIGKPAEKCGIGVSYNFSGKLPFKFLTIQKVGA